MLIHPEEPSNTHFIAMSGGETDYERFGISYDQPTDDTLALCATAYVTVVTVVIIPRKRNQKGFST
jgi:hypothetical protein